MDESADTVTKDALAEGLIGLLKPAVEEVDERVRNVRQARKLSLSLMDAREWMVKFRST